MSWSSPAPNALGTLKTFPPEVRAAIFKRLLPEDFRQVFTVVDSKIVYAPLLSSPEPSFLSSSKEMRAEIVDVSMVDGTCTVEIDSERISTNFLATRWMIAPSPKMILERSQPDYLSFQLPTCKIFEIIIVPPFPRSTEEFLVARRNVELFVETLNNSKSDFIPKLSVRLQHQHNGGCRCGYNDFAMLMGPLSKLRKRCRAVMIYRTTGFHTFVPDIEKQCDLIEQAVAGSPEAQKLLAYQQYMLEIKLPLSRIDYPLSIPQWVQQQPRVVPDQSSAARVLRACHGLKDWCRAYGESRKHWLEPLKVEMEAGNTPSSELLEQIFEGHDRSVALWWAAGLATRVNPFWDEESMS